jgi:two-component sensor histidine kinase
MGVVMNSDRSGPQIPHAVTAGYPDPSAQRCGSCWIVEEADHRIANHLSMLAGYVQQKASELARQPENLNLEQVQFALQSVRFQIGVTARLHRALTSARRTPALDFGDHLRELCASLLSLAPGRIELASEIPSGCFVGAAKVLPLSCILAEVLTNAAKHGVSDGRPVHLRVSCRPTGRAGVTIEIVDDGPGLPVGFDPATDGGVGFRLLRNLSKQLEAEMVFESGLGGVRFQIALPSGSQ